MKRGRPSRADESLKLKSPEDLQNGQKRKKDKIFLHIRDHPEEYPEDDTSDGKL